VAAVGTPLLHRTFFVCNRFARFFVRVVNVRCVLRAFMIAWLTVNDLLNARMQLCHSWWRQF